MSNPTSNDLTTLITLLRGEPLPANTLPRGPQDALTAEQVREHQRWRLIAATATIIARDGYHRASVDAICRTSGVSRRTFYDLFGNKDRACEAAFDIVTNVVTAVEMAIDTTSLSQLIDSMLYSYLGLLEAVPHLTEMLLIHALATPETRRKHVQAVDTYAAALSEVFAGARGAGLPIAELDHNDLVALLGGINQLCIRHIITTGSVVGLTTLAPDLHQILDRTLRRHDHIPLAHEPD